MYSNPSHKVHTNMAIRFWQRKWLGTVLCGVCYHTIQQTQMYSSPRAAAG